MEEDDKNPTKIFELIPYKIGFKINVLPPCLEAAKPRPNDNLMEILRRPTLKLSLAMYYSLYSTGQYSTLYRTGKYSTLYEVGPTGQLVYTCERSFVPIL